MLIIIMTYQHEQENRELCHQAMAQLDQVLWKRALTPDCCPPEEHPQLRESAHLHQHLTVTAIGPK